MSGIACRGQTPKRKTCPMNPRFLGSWRHVEIARAVSAMRSVLVHIRRRWPSFQEEGEYGGYEYAAYHQRPESGNEQHQLGSGVLYQPLGKEAADAGSAGSRVPLCEDGQSGTCAQMVPCDHCKSHQSECNRTGQHCSGRRNHGGGGDGGGIGITCGDVGGAIGGAVGGAIWGPPGAVGGSGVGGVAGSHAGEAICH
jgi:hypothetical protein